MFNELRRQATLIRILIILFIITLSIHLFEILSGFLQNFSDIILILFISWLVSFVLEPLVELVSKSLKISKAWSTLFIYILIASIFTIGIILLIPIIVGQIQALISISPQLLSQVPPFASRFVDNFILYLSNIVAFIPSVAQFLFSVFIVLIISFYFIIDKNKITQEIYDLTPTNWHEQIKFVIQAIDKTFASFIRIQLLFGLIAGLITWVILEILGIELALAMGFLSGILNILPLIGPILGLIPPVLLAFTIDPAKGLIVLLIILISQQIVFNIWAPRLMGNAFKLHPLVVLISFFIGFKIAGGFGAIFAIPILSILIIVIRNLSHYLLKRM